MTSTTFDAVLSDVFDRSAERRIPSAADERAAISLAQDGDEAATLDLVYAYAPTLRAAAARHERTLGREEARQATVLGLLEAVHAFDLSSDYERLAAIVWEYVADAVQTAAGTMVAISVPSRTLKRFFGILRRADGDLEAAALAAPKHELSTESFWAIVDALRVDPLDVKALGGTKAGIEGRHAVDGPSFVGAESHARPLWQHADRGTSDAEDRILAEVALRAVDGFSRDVCRLAYGFSEADPIPDAEIAHRLGYSRPKVQRTRTTALVKMRDALGL